MLTEKPMHVILKFTIPVLIGNLLQQLYSIVDRIIVGQFVGVAAFSAVGAAMPISNMFMGICIGMSAGTGIIVSQYFGAKNEKNVSLASFNGLMITVILSIIVSIVGIVFCSPLLHLLNTPESIFSETMTYMIIYLAGSFAVALYYTPFSILQAIGDAKTPLLFLGICSVLNIILDLIFVVPLKMGVAGAAIATVIAQFISAILCLRYCVKNVSLMSTAFKEHHIDVHMILTIIKIGIPSVLQYTLVYLSSTILQGIVNGFGETVIGTFSATSQIEQILYTVFISIGTALTTFAGQNKGAGNLDRVKMGTHSGLIINTCISILSVVILFLFGNQIMSMFVNDSDIVSLSTQMIQLTSIFFVIEGIYISYRHVLTGCGDSTFAFLCGLIEIMSRIGFGFLLTLLFGIMGIWYTTFVTWFICMIAGMIRWLQNRWTKETIA